MQKSTFALVGLAFFALSSSDALAQQRSVACQTVDPYPRLPYAFTAYTRAVSSRSAGTQKTRTPFVIFQNPPRTAVPRFLTINSVSIKGLHPANSYLAIELRTSSQADQRLPPIAVPGTFDTYPRHFLYGKFETNATDIHVREDNLQIPVALGANVFIGIQNSAEAAVEPMAVTITGTITDACLWGK